MQKGEKNMKHYSIMPSDWDYAYEAEVKEFAKRGLYLPCQVGEVVGSCGSLYPYVTTKKAAIAFAKRLKGRFPYVRFDLMVGEAWGETRLVQSF